MEKLLFFILIIFFTSLLPSCGGKTNLQRENAHISRMEQINDLHAGDFIYNLKGSGDVIDLSQAIKKDDSGQLKSYLSQFVNSQDASKRSSLMDQILFRWSESDGIAPNNKGEYIDARKLTVIEKFLKDPFASPYGPNPTYESSIHLKEAYRLLFEMYYGQLMARTHMKRLYSMTGYQWNNEIGELKLNLNDVIRTIKNDLISNAVAGRTELGEFARTLRGMKVLNKYDYLAFREVFISQDPKLGWVIDSAGLPIYDNVHQGYLVKSPHIEGTDDADAVKGSLTAGDGIIHGENGDDVIYGTTRDEILINCVGDAIMVGGGGNDVIWAWEDDDILDGGPGNDILYGGTGNDLFIFRRGSGQDVIIDFESTPGNNNTIWMGNNLTPPDISIGRLSNDLILRIKNTSDMITVKDYFLDIQKQAEKIRFQDNTIWSKSDIMDKINIAFEENNTIKGMEGDGRQNGTKDNDIMTGNSGDNFLNGAAGDDIIYGGPGNDTLEGGIGNDRLYGEKGDDIYLFSRGSGHDIIYDHDETPGNIDTIIMGSDIKPAKINIRRNCDNLVIKTKNGRDSLTISNFFTGDLGGYQVEQIKFADGSIWDVVKIKQLTLKAISGKITMAGYSTPDVIRGGDGDDFISGNGGDDTLYGGKGNDELIGDNENDTLYGEKGDDRLFGSSGDDVIYGGQGNDIINGGSGDDTLDGEAGNDTLYGEEGNDTYIFGPGYREDIIFDSAKNPDNKDTILLKSNIKPTDVILRRNGVNLVIVIKGTKDKLTIGNWFSYNSDEFQIEQIKFPDGIVWDMEKIKRLVGKGSDINR